MQLLIIADSAFYSCTFADLHVLTVPPNKALKALSLPDISLGACSSALVVNQAQHD